MGDIQQSDGLRVGVVMQSSDVSAGTVFNDLEDGYDSKVQKELLVRHVPRSSSYSSKVFMYEHLDPPDIRLCCCTPYLETIAPCRLEDHCSLVKQVLLVPLLQSRDDAALPLKITLSELMVTGVKSLKPDYYHLSTTN